MFVVERVSTDMPKELSLLTLVSPGDTFSRRGV